MILLKQNIVNIRKRIELAASLSGRSGEDIILIAVTKTVEPDVINEALSLGISHIGENRVQQILKKYDRTNFATWHLIGHLQSNKVKYIIDKAALIHSVDSIGLLKEINKQASKINKIQDILIQLNISGEESKFGISAAECDDFLHEAAGFDSIRVKGLMTMAPIAAAEDELRKIFTEANKIFLDIKDKQTHNISMDFLSMGMTEDFDIAIECGANMVRIGNGIFGSIN